MNSHKSPVFAALVSTAVVALVGCSKSDAPATPAPAPAPSASAAAPEPAHSASPPEFRSAHLPPSGPILAIQAGKGVGPIFLGATIPTIERQMALPCEEKTADTCHYFDRAVDFFLEHGKLVRIRVSRVDRPAGGKLPDGKPRRYGVFHGAIPPSIQMGMLPWAVHEYLGKPLSTTKVTAENDNHTVYIEHYKGMDIEFDKLDSGKIVMGGVWIPGEPPKKK